MKIIHLIPSLPHLLILHLALTSILCVTPNASKKCRALVLEGGGDKGSFQVGVLKALVDNLPPKEVKWDVVTGVSVGSINAVGVGLHEIGEEKKAIDWMVDMWGNLGKTDIYTNWNFGILQGLFYKEGLWNNEPEYEYLKSTFDQFPDKKLKRRVNINTCEINTGEYFRFEESTEWEKLPAAVRASSAVPLVFPPLI